MPRVIDFGAPLGTREFPDDATDQEILAEYDRIRPQPGIGDYVQQATRGLVTGAAREIASLPKAIGTGAAELRRLVGYVPGLDFPTREGEEFSTSPQASEAYRLGQLIESAGEAIATAEVPALRESFLATKVPEAVGSGVGFLLGGGATRLLRRGVTSAATRAAERELVEKAAEKGAPLALKAAAAVSEGAEIGTLGAVSQFQSEYEKAIQAGADRDTALKAGLYGLPIGATEAIPLGNMLRRLDRFEGGGFSRYLLTAGKEAFEEALQEAAQNFASNAVEKGLYNEAKSLTDDLIPQAGAGGAAGFLLSTLTQALGAGARRLRKGAPDAISSGTQPTTTGKQAPGLVEGTEERVRLRSPTAQVGVEAQAGTPEAIIAALKPYGVELSPQLTIFNDPTPAAPAARTQFGEGNVFQRIELNQAKLPTAKEVQDKFEHEVAHVGSDSGALSEPLNLLTPQERGDIALEMSRLGYAEGSQNEFDARGTQALVSAWQNRTWFGQLVGRVTAWANETLGIKLTRRAAEAIAVRAVGRSIERLRQPAPRRPGLIELGNAFLTPLGMTRAEAALTAHHGTPHEVDRFSTQKIGTGEGAQVYGWGLYFAQKPETAKTYAESLTARRTRAWIDPRQVAADTLRDYSGNVQAAKGAFQQDAREGSTFAGDVLSALDDVQSLPPATTGNQYTVSINAENDELLDWDKRLSKQPSIQQKLAASPSFSDWQREIGDPSGADLYEWIRSDRIRRTGRNVRAAPSNALRSLGIKGIRYLDQGSRARGGNPNLVVSQNKRGYYVEDKSQTIMARLSDYFKTEAEAQAELERVLPKVQPTYNYVIFDENDITITHRNGQPVKASQLQAQQRTEEAKAEPISPPPIQGAQVAGAAAQLGRVAEESYGKREAATTQLSGLAYERQQYKVARQELRRLTEVATGRLFQEGLSIEDAPGYFPDPTEGVGIEEGQVVVGDQFINKLNAAGINPDVGNTKSLQGEVYFERESHRLVNLRSQIDTLQRAMGYYAALGVEQSEIDKIQETINKLSTQAAALGETQWNGKTIGDRANEIEAAESARPGLLAQRSSLGLSPVAEFFGRQVGGYREFVEKVRQGLRLAAALRDKATTPEELRDAVEGMTGWLALPEEVRDAVLSGRGLTDEQRGAAFARLAEAFEDFDIQRQAMGALRDSRTQVINQRVRELLDLISSAKIKEGMQEVLIADVLAALDGETGGTGTLQSQATAQALKGRISAIKNFALNLGKNIETNGALFAWLVNPSGPAPSGTALGVEPNTLQMILSEVKKNPAFGSAVVTLINSVDSKLKNLPVVQLEEIQQALQDGNPEVATAAGQKMISSAKARASLAASSQRQNLRELEKLDIERQALEQGEAMFNEVAASPEYRQLRDAVSNSPYGLVEPMDVANNTARTFRPFGGKGIPSHEGLRLDAADSPELKSEDFVRVAKWHKTAQEHLDAYDAAQALYDADPANNPSPASLGFDLPVIRGLRDAVSRSVPGSAQVLSTQSEGARWKVPWLVRVMNKTGWFRQHDFVAKMVGGSTGTDLRAKLGDWINHFLISRSVSQEYRDIPQLRHAAMKSHPEVQMNFQLYRTFWNEMAHWGRIFGSPLRVGFVLPGSGRAVTAEDLALLKRETEFEEDLRRKVTETSPVVGVRIKKGNREFVRAGAYVGDRGMPRHLNQRATAFINRIMRAYGENGSFDINTDLGATSTNPIVAFWSERPGMLVQHVLDSTRQDRAMRLDPLMAQAERTAAAEWMTNGTPPIQTVDELVTELVKHFPSAPGLNIREKVVEGLNNELNQYNAAARRLDSERRQRDAERNSKVQISFSADNEFTRPAAQLELPSELYDYGALSDSDHMLIQSRANHERVVAYALALQRARADLQQRLVDYRDSDRSERAEKEAFHGGTVDEAKDVLGILNKLYEDFDAAYKMGSPALTQGGWFREATGLLTSAVLALPTVNLRNMTQGQFEVYTMSQAMGLGGQRMLFAQALLNMPKTLARYALHIGSGLAKRTDMGATFLTGQNQQMFTKLVDAIAKMMFQGDYRASADRVHELGYDTREGFLDRMRRLWQATEESSQEEDIRTARVGGRRLGRLAGLTPNALKALFDTIGVQESDLTINSSLLDYATMLEKRLQEVATEYGAERERQGLTTFDPTDARWKLKPDEWAGGNQQAAKDSLGLFELFMEQAAAAEGFQLEKSLWDYYQRAKAGPTRLFTERQFDAVQRGLLAQFNASTPANRASAAAGNNVVRNLLTLQGYVSDGLLKLLNAAIGGSRDRTAISGALAKLPILGALALMSVLIGYVVGAITGEWEKRVRGRAPSLPTPLDGDFWTSWKRWGEGTKRLALAQLFYLGDVLLAINGEISGNRGFDPAGRIFPLSLAQRALNGLRGMWKTMPQATLGQRLEPGKDVLRSLVPWYTELERVFGGTVNTAKQSERVIRGEAQIRDLLPEGRGASGFTGPQYGPTTIVRRGLMEAVSKMWEAQQRNDPEATAQAIEAAKVQLQKLQAYYEAKYIKAGSTPEAAAVKAQKDLWRDYQELNPVVAGMLGKRPTRAEYDLIRGGITGERAKVVDNGIAAWQAGAQALFGRAAPITREDVAAGRASSGGGRGGVVGIPSAIPRSRIGSLRRVGPLRRGRTLRAPRLAAGRTAAPRSLRRGGRALGIRNLRPRRPGIRRTTLPGVRRISAGRRRIGVVPRRRRRQAAAA